MASSEITQKTGILSINTFGVFDTNRTFPGLKQSAGRTTHNFEIEFMLDCSGKAFVDEKEYKLYPATILLCKPGQYRRSIFPFRCYYLHFSLSERSPYFAPLLAAPDYFRIIDSAKYADIFSDLLQHLTQNEENTTSDYTYAKILELFYLLCRDAKCNETYFSLRGTKRQTDDFIPRIISYITQNFDKKISLYTLSELFHYSPNYIQCIFRRVTGITLKNYLEDLRLKQSKIMLAETNDSLSEIALRCGFSSQSHFTACFRKKYGLTPHVWQCNTYNAMRGLYPDRSMQASHNRDCRQKNEP